MDEYEEEELMSYLENVGAFIWVGMDEDGERILKPNMGILKEVYPELYEVMLEEFNETLLDLYEAGLVQVEYDENLQARFKLSKEAYEFLEDSGYGMEQ